MQSAVRSQHGVLRTRSQLVFRLIWRGRLHRARLCQRSGPIAAAGVAAYRRLLCGFAGTIRGDEVASVSVSVVRKLILNQFLRGSVCQSWLSCLFTPVLTALYLLWWFFTRVALNVGDKMKCCVVDLSWRDRRECCWREKDVQDVISLCKALQRTYSELKYLIITLSVVLKTYFSKSNVLICFCCFSFCPRAIIKSILFVICKMIQLLCFCF